MLSFKGLMRVILYLLTPLTFDCIATFRFESSLNEKASEQRSVYANP